MVEIRVLSVNVISSLTVFVNCKGLRKREIQSFALDFHTEKRLERCQSSGCSSEIKKKSEIELRGVGTANTCSVQWAVGSVHCAVIS